MDVFNSAKFHFDRLGVSSWTASKKCMFPSASEAVLNTVKHCRAHSDRPTALLGLEADLIKLM